MRLILLTFLLAACSGAPPVPPRPVASPARIALAIQKDALFAPGLADDLAAELRQQVLQSRVGVPVDDATGADLLLKVVISNGNFTQATGWQWQLVHVKDGATLVAGRDTAAFGISVEDLAGGIVAQVASLDTAAYAGGNAPAAPAVITPPPAGGPIVAPDPKRWAVIVGIERYREALATATGAETDARAFADLARTHLGVPEANLKLLIGDRATRADLAGALLEWLPRNAVEPGGRVYVYFSGHGAPDPQTGDTYLVPYDTNPAYLKTGGLALAPLQATLANLPNQKVFFFLDACFSGQGDRSVLAAGTRPLVPVSALHSPPGLVTLAAAGATETAGTHPESGHGLFTHHLLAGLGGAADANSDGQITVAELGEHLIPRVRTEARRQNRDQTPSLALPPGFDPATPLR